MVIMSPGFNEFLVQPRRRTADGLPASPAQWERFPWSSFTSNMSMVWGLAHTNFVTVACFKTTALSVLYAALPWCANDGPQTVRRPPSKAKDMSNLLFNRNFLNWNRSLDRLATRSLLEIRLLLRLELQPQR